MAVSDALNNPISSSTDIANIQPFRYRGYYYDYESGFYYLQSRYYDPVTHRFINADGLVSTGTGVLGYNMFAYCENNPVNYSDSTGERLDDLFAERKKERLKQGGRQRRRSNQDCNLNSQGFGEYVSAVASAMTINAGYGCGFYGNINVGDASVFMGIKATMLSVIIDGHGIDVGNECYYGGGIESIGFLNGYYHSLNCERYKKVGQHSGETCINSKIYDSRTPEYYHEIAGFDIYVIIGLHCSIGWDESKFWEEIGDMK